MIVFSEQEGVKYLALCIVAVLLFILAMPFGIATAQTTSTSSSSSLLNQDGSSVPTTIRQGRIRGYRQQSGDLQQKISALDITANPSVLMPVLFGVGLKDISPNFGDPRDGGARTHEGEDIMAVKGTPIVSPTGAVVLRTVTGVDEGNAVYTANPGGETFVYMHLDRFGEGVVTGKVLATGSLIGYVGNTGNASGGPAHLHFEIHNSSGTPTDPFPRLTSEISLQEKISDIAAILGQTSDSSALSRFLVTNFRGTFISALAANITLPASIIDALASIPESIKPIGGGGSLPSGDLALGSSGTVVAVLQSYLIEAASGVAATRLAGAGATGNFGPITEAALVEYQVKVGIYPASGYYGPETRAFIGALSFTTPQPVIPNPPATGVTTPKLSRDLYRNISGEDVRTLQKILNANGYRVAAGTDAGSPGNETIYFGPATETAVIRFQVAHSISPPVGYVGPITRASLLSL